MYTIIKHTNTNAHSGLKQTNILDWKIFWVTFGLRTGHSPGSSHNLSNLWPLKHYEYRERKCGKYECMHVNVSTLSISVIYVPLECFHTRHSSIKRPPEACARQQVRVKVEWREPAALWTWHLRAGSFVSHANGSTRQSWRNRFGY